jgi:hypothetical protein
MLLGGESKQVSVMFQTSRQGFHGFIDEALLLDLVIFTDTPFWLLTGRKGICAKQETNSLALFEFIREHREGLGIDVSSGDVQIEIHIVFDSVLNVPPQGIQEI